jgi:CheY-like chemotaxis protein
MNGIPQNDGKTSATIIVVDDEVVLLDLAKTILQPLGYNVLTFNDPQKALEVIAASRPALVLTDYAMGGTTGLDLLRECRRMNPQQKVILVSGTVDERIFADQTIKPNSFLPKPYQIRDLVEAVRVLVSS